MRALWRTAQVQSVHRLSSDWVRVRFFAPPKKREFEERENLPRASLCENSEDATGLSRWRFTVPARLGGAKDATGLPRGGFTLAANRRLALPPRGQTRESPRGKPVASRKSLCKSL